MTTDFIPDNDQTRARREHLEKIRELVGNAYPNKFPRTNVAAGAEGEDTITALADHATLRKIVNSDAFNDAFDALTNKVAAGERPAPEDLAPINAELNEIKVRVSGRIATPPRVMGKAAFVHLSDGRERLQIYLRKQDARAISNDTGQPVDDFDSGWQLLQYLDHGDFVGVAGELFLTKTGELSVHVREIQFLAKALVPMPDKMHGISDPEIRQRQRYVDLIAGSLKVEREEGELTTREVFERRSKLISEMRRHLDAHGYIEVETPMLSPIATGAAARPFETYHNALDIKLYARIAPELYLKRLLVGGFERVYELNRNFRNEGISTRHNPEFTMLEFYCAYMDVNGMMDFCEEMLRQTVKTVTGNATIQLGDYQFSLEHKFQRLTMKKSIAKHLSEDYLQLTGKNFDIELLNDFEYVGSLSMAIHDLELLRTLENADVEFQAYKDQFEGALLIVDDEATAAQREMAREHLLAVANMQIKNIGPISDSEHNEMARNIETIFGKVAEPYLVEPTFIVDFPKPISPLSKASPEDPTIAERFELYIAGMEVANGFSELNDPIEQHQRFEEQGQQRERGDDEAMQMDMDYVRALSYGMPPAAGIGIGIDRLTMLLTNRRSIRDVILFPHLRPRREAEGELPADAESPAPSGTQN